MRVLSRLARVGAALAAASAVSGVALDAQAADCPAFTNPIYVTGSSAAAPVMPAIAQLMAAQTTPITLVYVKNESCQGVSYFTAQTPLTAAATYYPGGVATTCNFPAGTAPLADASASDVYAATCPNTTLTASQKEFDGPIQAMTFIVHPSSTESSISEEAAHAVMKDVSNASFHVAPWIDPANIFIRPGGTTGSGTRGMIGAALGLADGDWDAALTIKPGSGDVLAAVAGDSAAANASIGILSVPNTDINRTGCTNSCTPVKVLAYQAKDQKCGYLPDSTAQSFDKLNVREGRYWIWGNIHFVTAVDNAGNPVSTSNPGTADTWVQTFVNAMTLKASLAAADKQAIIDATAKGHVVAQCAMRVKRAGEVGGEQSFVPDEPCGCYWESKANGAAPASCHACPGGDGDCAGQTGAPKCRYGFCEAQ